MDLLDQMNRVTFLGPEFLTWLWFHTETQGETFRDPEDDLFEVWFDDRLVVGSTLVNAQEDLFKGGHPATSLEARTALRLGKLATEARLRFVRDGQEWSFVFKAAELSCSSVKVPTVLAKEEDERLYERVFLLEKLDTMVKGLFGQFLKIRFADTWESTALPAIRAWVGSDLRHEHARAADVRPRQRTEEPRPLAGKSERNPDVPPWEDPLGAVD